MDRHGGNISTSEALVFGPPTVELAQGQGGVPGRRAHSFRRRPISLE